MSCRSSPGHRHALNLLQEIVDSHIDRGQDIMKGWIHHMETQVLNGFTELPPLKWEDQYVLLKKLNYTRERVKRGESVEEYREGKEAVRVYNPEFDWRKYRVGVNEARGDIAKTVRKEPLKKTCVLPWEIPQMACEFGRADLEYLEMTIHEIADWFELRSGEPQHAWEQQLLGLAERLRNWEGLPDPKTLFVGKIEAIKNEKAVEFTPSSRYHQLLRFSLQKRISLRTAARIGYVGRSHPDGGMTFSTL